jgi:Tfp pilus assembly protein FimT
LARRPHFTIVEVTLSLAALAVVASFAIPAWFERAEVTLENACVLLARDLRTAQNAAAVRRFTTTVEFAPDGSGYRVLGPDGEVTLHPRTERAFERDYGSDGVFEGVEIAEVDLNGGRRILFTPDGRALQGGDILLRFQEDERYVRVEAGTGFVTIVGSSSGWTDDGL